MKRASIGFALLICGFLAGLVLTGRLRSASDLAASQAGKTAAAITAPPTATSGGLPDFTGVAAQAVKAVVNISSVRVVRTPNSPWANDPMFQYFFGSQDEMFGSRARPEMSLGSGVLISSDGYVVTNVHARLSVPIRPPILRW